MARNKESREEKMSALQEKLMSGVKEIYESGKWAEYIAVMSRFPHYSINNCILIASQCPEASYVCGYKKWNEFNRNVVKGESGIMIFAPIKGKVQVEEPIYDANNHPVLNEDGTQAKEKVEREYKSFRPCYVFDVSQTEGDPLPTLANQLNDGVEDFEKLKDALMAVSPVPISFEDIPGSANGYYAPKSEKIVVQSDMSQLQTIKTMIHEIAHATLGHGGEDDKWDKESKEVQAESTAFWVAGMLGLDTSDYSFGYIAGWSKDREITELKENLDLIKRTADGLVSKVDDYLKQKTEEKEQAVVSEIVPVSKRHR
ncbi:TPA: ImmA/IrrE family metallo-endopeptidase [Clostridioides difficile]|nr:ImmA/IrrE family metallo-endopeptidase [Clostridioides difficile]HCQ5593585.1 ImmA/IrrE family metallo-endopeptidase [Clostridioides difficile]HCQ6314182.1 ImmA/IrrE family metallo-endopeptidase [Clostridioides difficile]HCQ6315739.1 ImmA/IrrE family metallo-endopeptidase [Clostridioides difficile]